MPTSENSAGRDQSEFGGEQPLRRRVQVMGQFPGVPMHEVIGTLVHWYRPAVPRSKVLEELDARSGGDRRLVMRRWAPKPLFKCSCSEP